jgi:hypothetical protein
MTAPLVAIVGSYNPDRADELSLRNIEQAKAAGVELGRQLATQGCHIVVYASYPYLLEVDVVAGYVEVKKANPEPNCIHVHYSVQYDQPTFPEETDHRGLFNFKPDTSPAWEVSFYASLRQVDGLLMLGGGPSSMIAGVVAMGYGKPICAVASFGGYAKKIWELLPVQQKLLTAEEIFAMAEQWRPELAKRYVEILLRQLDQLASAKQKEAEAVARAQESFRQQLAEKDEKLKLELDRQSESLTKAFAEQMAAERKAQSDSRNTVKLYAVVSAVFLILALGLWGFALGRPGINPAWLIAFLIAVPLAGGISGSTIQVAFGALGIGDTKPLGNGQLPPVITNAAMGLVGGGITMLIYITTQFIAIGDEIQPKHYLRLIPFALVTAFAAGFALDVVVRKLRETAEKGLPAPFPPAKNQ